MEGNNIHKGTFLSSGGSGYRAPSPHRPNIKEIVQHVRQCRDEITRNVIILQQAALEQERLETYYEQLAVGTKALIEVVEELEAGTVLTSEWVRQRDEATRAIHIILGESQQNQLQEQK